MNWMIKTPGNFHGIGPIRANNLNEAKQWLRQWLNVKRLPSACQAVVNFGRLIKC